MIKYRCRKCGYTMDPKNPNKKWYPCPVCQRKMLRIEVEEKNG